MFMKRPRHRVFDYPTRFYKQEIDEQERRKRRLGFKRERKHISRKRNSLIWLLFILAVVFIILKLQGSI
jgi:hypothetical protein